MKEVSIVGSGPAGIAASIYLKRAGFQPLVFEKDTVGTTEGRLEIYLGRLNYLRLDHDTKVEFETVPPLRKTNMNIRVLQEQIKLFVTEWLLKFLLISLNL